MLQNAALVAKIGFDTAENEPSKIWQNFANVATIVIKSSPVRHAAISSPRASAESSTDPPHTSIFSTPAAPGLDRLQQAPLEGEIGFDAAENGPSTDWATYLHRTPKQP